ncbi:MAG: hypothetical protein GC181_14305 [Bacteroidetes bacterium]|nr:hypothetical protein [Bacteroidota bacterium]
MRTTCKLALVGLMLPLFPKAQAPSNDDCSSAFIFNIGNNGFDTGVFVSPYFDVTEASRETGEICSPELSDYGNCEKTIWFKFYIGTTRNVNVSLIQKDSSIPEIFAGFNIYKVGDCSYNGSNLYDKLIPINKFGLSGNLCTEGGWFLVQAGFKNKAKGSVQLKLSINQSEGDTYDRINSPFLIKSGYGSDFLSLNACNSMETEELSSSLPVGFDFSVWVQFVAKSGETYHYLKSPDIKTFYYKIFKGKPDKTEIGSSNYSKHSTGDTLYFDNNACKPLASNDTFYLLVVYEQLQNQLTLKYQSSTAQNLPYQMYNSSVSPKVIDLPTYTYQQSDLQFGCDSKLSLNHCSGNLPDYYLDPDSKDTFQYTSYLVLNIGVNCVLELNSVNVLLNALYSGDLRNTCNLIPVDLVRSRQYNPARFCVGKGTYTLIITSSNANVKELNYGVNVKSSLFTAPRHATIIDPEVLPDFNPNSNKQIKSDTLPFSSKQIVYIDGVKIEGRLSFKEIKYTKAGSSTIYPKGANFYLFKGRASQNTAKKIAELDYSRTYSSFGLSSSWFGGSLQCFILEQGYYTFVFVGKEDTIPCNQDLYFLGIQGHPICTVNNVEPQLAMAVNNNKNILEIATETAPSEFEVQLDVCRDCMTQNLTSPAIGCNLPHSMESVVYRYYTFSLGRNITFSPEKGIVLYNGDCSKNPGLVYDTSNIIALCENGDFFNLEGGRVYTLLYPDKISMNQSKPVLYFYDLHKTNNDFISQSYDLGTIKHNTTTISDSSWKTVHSNGLPGELPFVNKDVYMEADTTLIRYPEKANTKFGLYGPKTCWFTFRTEGINQLVISNIGLQSNSSSNVILYKYHGREETDFAGLLANGFDTSSALFERVLATSTSRNLKLNIENGICSDSRYFICLVNYARPLECYQLKIEGVNSKYSNEGDWCRNAEHLKIDSFGTYKLSTSNRCHTYGNSPFEENDPPSRFNITSWFSFTIDSIESFDLTIKEKSGANHFNLFAGNCSALTPVTGNGESKAYFTLTCMGRGTYYIQSFNETSSFEKVISYEIAVKPSQSLSCKPFDFINPLANYSFTGGCHTEDTIWLNNRSTNGDDIIYQWFVNDSLISTKRNTYFTRNDGFVQDHNSIKLIVKNGITMLADTLLKSYIRDTRIYKFKLSGTDSAFCFETSKFYAITDFPNKLNYEWSEFRFDEPVRSEYLKYTDTLIKYPSTPFMNYLHAYSENCNFYDSIQPGYIKTLHRYQDTILCEEEVLTLAQSDDVYSADNHYFSSGEVYELNQAGNHIIQFKVGDYCYYQDTIDVSYDYGKRLIWEFQEVYACNQDTVHLKYSGIEQPKSYTWNSGDTTAEIVVNAIGNYNLKGDFSRCRKLDYTFVVKLESIDTNRLEDQVVCRFDSVKLVNPYSSFKVINRTPEINSFIVEDSFLYELELKRDRCHFADSAFYHLYPILGKTIDSIYCDSLEFFDIKLDGRPAESWFWWNANIESRYLNVGDYGTYSVARINEFNCRDTMVYNVKNGCPYLVYVPEAFSPGISNGLNDGFAPVIISEYEKFEMQIFNRWGEKIFYTNRSESWNGYYSGYLCPAGFYAYTITVYQSDGSKKYYRGTVLLMR